MNRSIQLLSAVMLFFGVVYLLASQAAPIDAATALPAKQNVAVAATPLQQQTNWEYGRLLIDVDFVNWQGGESNIDPQNFSLAELYRRLGGKSRANKINLLNTIGQAGWELVSVDDVEMVWIFKRPQP